ncbi:tetratricopeptide repeat protein [Arsukibacterium sp.]|uniref:tetratricopeptide repeat protein n=1 Tax=Arsukibacterium sp. TaxID=1977258 RepID=UPI002FDB8B5C
MNINRLLLAMTLVGSLSLIPLHAQTNIHGPSDLGCSQGMCNAQIRTLHSLARYGSFEAMTLLSMIYATGDGREADPKKALSYLQRAVRYRHPMAVFLLSEWHREGLVVEQDLEQAEALLTQAVELHFSPAQFKRAMQLLQLSDDDSVAAGMDLLHKASNTQLVDAMFVLARLKQEGLFTAQDLEGAATLFKNLVLSGHELSRPYLRETIAALAPQPEAAKLVADLQQSYDMEVIQVIGRDFKTDTMLSNMVVQLQRTGLYVRGSMSRIRTTPCDGTHGCASIQPRAGDRDLIQTLTHRY